MDIESNTETASTPESSASPEVTSTPAAEASVASVGVSGDQDKQASAPAKTDAPAAFAPNFKYKAYSKEHEIPETYRKFITDQDSEKMIRELFEKSHGIESMKEHKAALQQQLQSTKSEYESLNKSLSTLSDFLNQGDMDSFFGALQIPEQKILQWAVQKAEYSDLSPEQKRVYDEAAEAKRRAYWNEQQSRHYEQQVQQFKVQQRSTELESALSKPEVAQIAKFYDQRKGQNAFRNKVIQTGQAYWHMYQQDVPAEQIVSELAQEFGGFIQSQPQSPMSPQTLQSPKQVPVIPAVQGASGQSPAKKAIMSIEDLEREYMNYSKSK